MLAVLPVIGVTFTVVLGRVRKLFTKAQEAIDWLNKVINESILGAALIRLLNSQHYEYEKFLAANTEARDISLSILRLFASLIPVIIFCDQPGDADDPDARRPFRDRRLDEPRRFHRLQQLPRDPDLPGHHDRLHEQRDGAGRRVVSAHLEACSTRRTPKDERHARSPTCAATSRSRTSS